MSKEWEEYYVGDADYIWMLHDYLWVKVDNTIYLSRDQGETFVRVGVFRFALINVWHIAGLLWKRWLR